MQPFKSEQKVQDQQWEKWIPGVNPYASSKRIRPTPETPNFQPTIQGQSQGLRTPFQNIKSQMLEQSTGEIKPECQSIMKLDGGQNDFGHPFQTPARPCAYGNNTPKPHIEQSAQVRQVDIALGSKVQSQPMGTPHIPRAHQNPLFGQSQQEMVVNESTKKRVDYGQQGFQDAQIAITPQQMVQSSQRQIQEENSSRLLVLYQDEAWKRQHSQRSLLPQSQPGKPYVLWQSKPKEASQAQQASQQYQSSQHFMNQQNSQHAIQMPQSSFKSNIKGWQNKENDL